MALKTKHMFDNWDLEIVIASSPYVRIGKHLAAVNDNATWIFEDVPIFPKRLLSAPNYLALVK